MLLHRLFLLERLVGHQGISGLSEIQMEQSMYKLKLRHSLVYNQGNLRRLWSKMKRELENMRGDSPPQTPLAFAASHSPLKILCAPTRPPATQARAILIHYKNC